jgi:hypothetical protein
MKFPAKASVDFKIAPAGNHIAICNGVVDFGMQPGNGAYPEPKHIVYVRFELPTEIVSYLKDDQQVSGPMSVGRKFTASMSAKANLRKFIESWFGRNFPSDDAAASFDVKALLGRKCLVNITHNEKGDKTYANLASATPIPKGMQADHAQVNESIYFSLDESGDREFRELPEWMQETINKRIKEQPKQTPIDDGQPFDDGIPF